MNIRSNKSRTTTWKRCLWAVVAALALSTVVFASTAAAQETYTLRFGHVLAPNTPFSQGFLNWAESVEERTDGGVQMPVYPSSQLGVEEDIISQIRQGAPIGWNTDAARLGSYVPGISVVNGPYFFSTVEGVSPREAVSALHKTPLMQKWLDKLATDYGIKVMCFNWIQGYRNFFTDKVVDSPDDLAGLRIRTPPAPIWQESIRALGATPVALNFGSVYPALQQQAIDGAELVYPNITAANLFEVLDYANETQHILLVNFEIVSAKWFSNLPKEYQTALVEECRQAGRATSTVQAKAIQKAKAQVIEKGMTINEDVNLKAFKKAGQKAYKALGLLDAKKQLQSQIHEVVLSETDE